MTVSVIADALADAARFFEQMPEVAERSAAMAINSVAVRSSLPEARREMRKQIDFPKGYLEQSDRLYLSKRASKGNLQAVIRGRDRPTSLARFRVPGQTPQNTRGKPLRLQVKPGKTVTVNKAFLVTLRGGNTGLAVRLKNGQTLRNSDRAIYLGNNVYLLYGPSVEQVFQSVASDIAPKTIDDVADEFLRQFARLTNG